MSYDTDKKADIALPDWLKKGLDEAQFDGPPRIHAEAQESEGEGLCDECAAIQQQLGAGCATGCDEEQRAACVKDARAHREGEARMNETGKFMDHTCPICGKLLVRTQDSYGFTLSCPDEGCIGTKQYLSEEYLLALESRIHSEAQESEGDREARDAAWLKCRAEREPIEGSDDWTVGEVGIYRGFFNLAARLAQSPTQSAEGLREAVEAWKKIAKRYTP